MTSLPHHESSEPELFQKTSIFRKSFARSRSIGHGPEAPWRRPREGEPRAHRAGAGPPPVQKVYKQGFLSALFAPGMEPGAPPPGKSTRSINTRRRPTPMRRTGAERSPLRSLGRRRGARGAAAFGVGLRRCPEGRRRLHPQPVARGGPVRLVFGRQAHPGEANATQTHLAAPGGTNP